MAKMALHRGPGNSAGSWPGQTPICREKNKSLESLPQTTHTTSSPRRLSTKSMGTTGGVYGKGHSCSATCNSPNLEAPKGPQSRVHLATHCDMKRLAMLPPASKRVNPRGRSQMFQLHKVQKEARVCLCCGYWAFEIKLVSSVMCSDVTYTQFQRLARV